MPSLSLDHSIQYYEYRLTLVKYYFIPKAFINPWRALTNACAWMLLALTTLTKF